MLKLGHEARIMGSRFVALVPFTIIKWFSNAIYRSKKARCEEMQRTLIELNKTATETERELSSAKSSVDNFDREISLHRDEIVIASAHGAPRNAGL